MEIFFQIHQIILILLLSFLLKIKNQTELIIFNTGVDPKLSNIYDNLLSKFIDNFGFDYTYKWDLQTTPTIQKKEVYHQVYKYNYMNTQNAKFSKWFKKCFKKVEKLDI